MKIRAYSIIYDCAGAPEGCGDLLPDELTFEVLDNFNVVDDGAEWISQQTGWLVHSFNYEELQQSSNT
jgi:hypothetical protein